MSYKDTMAQYRQAQQSAEPLTNETVEQPAQSSYKQKMAQFRDEKAVQDTQPKAGLIPMAQRVGTGLVEGVKNLPNAVVDFTKQGIDAGKTEFTQGYNPIEAYTSGSLGAIQGVGNLLEGVWNLPGDAVNAYYGVDKVKATHPLTEGIPNILSKTQWGQNYLQGVQTLQERYPLSNLLMQEVGEEVPAMLIGAGTAKYGMKAGKIAKTAEKISDVGYGKLARHSALAGFGEGFITDPAQGQQFNMTPEQRLAGRFTNATTGAVIAPAMNLGIKAGGDFAPRAIDGISDIAVKSIDATKNVSGKIVKSFNDIVNAPTSFDTLQQIRNNYSGKISEKTIEQVQLRNLKNDLDAYNTLLDVQQSGEYFGQKLDEAQVKAVKRRIYKLEDSFKNQNDFINQNIKNIDIDTLKNIQSNIQGRFNSQSVEVKDGYNAYGVPVEPQAVKAQRFENYYRQAREKHASETNLKNAEIENKKNLDAFKKKVDEINAQRLQQNLPELTNAEIKQMPEFQQLNINFDEPIKGLVEKRDIPEPPYKEDATINEIGVDDDVFENNSTLREYTHPNKLEVDTKPIEHKSIIFDDAVEPAVTNYGKHKYDKTQASAFNTPRIKLETETQAKTRIIKDNKKKKTIELKDAKNYDYTLKDGVKQWNAEIEKRRYQVGKDINELINISKQLSKEVGASDKQIREIMPFLRERTELPSALERPDLHELWNKLNDAQKEHIRTIADDFADRMEQYWEEYKSVRASDAENLNDISNHISHIWDLDKKKNRMMTNYFATRSRFAKARTIKTLFDGIEGIELDNGEIFKAQPKVLDYAELLKTQSDSTIKATIDKVLADEVKNFKTADGINLVLPASKAPSDWVEVNHPAINKTVVRPIDTKVGEIITPKLQNILSEIGVAIGNRLSSRSKNAGVYRHKKIRPEISLQRWFSNKTLAHEIGHALDYHLGIDKDGFIERHRNELLELNEERIKKLKHHQSYAKSNKELIAELFGFLFNDPKLTAEIAPNATAEIITKLSNNDVLKNLLPENFDWENAKHVLEEKTVEMYKMPVKVHPDIAETLKTVFETPTDKSTAGELYDRANAFLKQAQLGFSGFHMVALSEAGLANLGVTKTAKILNPAKIFDEVKNGNWNIYKDDAIAKQAINDGLQIGATIDIHRGLVESMLDDTAHWIEKNVPAVGKPFSAPAKGLASVQKLNNKILWDYLHNNYKLETYKLLIDNEAQKSSGKLTKEVRQEIAQWVNDSFGGQVWENLGIKPSGKKWEQRLLLSPDWLRSTTRQALGAFSSETLQKNVNKLAEKSEFWNKARDLGRRWGLTSMTDDVTASGVRGRVARRFWMRAFIQYSIYSNALNAIFREKDRKENPELYPKKMTIKDYSILGNSKGSETYVFLGRNKDGTERYWRLGKQFRELPELASNPIEKLGGKASPMMQLISETTTSKSVGGYENRELSEKKGLERIPALGKVYAKSALPFSMNAITNPNKDITGWDMFAPTTKGMTFYKGREAYMDAMRKGDKHAISEVTKDLKRNTINPNKVYQSAKSELTKEKRAEKRKQRG